MEVQAQLNKTQLEILNMFSRELGENDILELKRLFTQFLAQKASELADSIWEAKGWTNHDMERMANEHMRAPYKNKK